MRRRHGIQRECIERWRTIDQHVTERLILRSRPALSDQRSYGVAQFEGAALIALQHLFDADEIVIGGHYE